MKIYITHAKRSAVGSFLGSLKDISPGKLAGLVIQDIVKNIDKNIIDEVIVGNVLSAGQGQGIGRQASVNGTLPYSTVAYSLNMLCGSGMKAVMNGISQIKSRSMDVVLAGGVESMSQSPYLVPCSSRTGTKLGDLKLVDSMIKDGLLDYFNDYHMGVTAENIASKYNIHRITQDKFAVNSQKKAIEANLNGKFKNEIVSIEIKAKKEKKIFCEDEYINKNTTFEKLSKLNPVFKKDGSVTAGNSSGINDGASFTLIASQEAVDKHDLIPLVEIIDVAQIGIDPAFMGLGPGYAIEKILNNNNLSIKDIDIFEINEAFAAQSLGVFEVLKDLYDIDDTFLHERVNVNGSAIALGHPIGASGNRIIVTLIHEMIKRKSHYAIASLCIGGGLGTSILLKGIR